MLARYRGMLLGCFALLTIGAIFVQSVYPVEAQLMAWAILPRDDEMPPGYVFNPDESKVYGTGTGVTKVYLGSFGTGWRTSADLATSPYLAAVGYDRNVAAQREAGNTVTTYGPTPGLGEASFIASRMLTNEMKLVTGCFLQGRWIGCVSQQFPVSRGDGGTQVDLLILMWSRAVLMP